MIDCMTLISPDWEGAREGEGEGEGREGAKGRGKTEVVRREGG